MFLLKRTVWWWINDACIAVNVLVNGDSKYLLMGLSCPAKDGLETGLENYKTANNHSALKWTDHSYEIDKDLTHQLTDTNGWDLRQNITLCGNCIVLWNTERPLRNTQHVRETVTASDGDSAASTQFIFISSISQHPRPLNNQRVHDHNLVSTPACLPLRVTYVHMDTSTYHATSQLPVTSKWEINTATRVARCTQILINSTAEQQTPCVKQTGSMPQTNP